VTGVIASRTAGRKIRPAPPEEGPVSVTITLQFQSKPDQADDVIDMLRKNLPDTRSYDGCESLVVHQSQDDPTMFLIYEQWAARPKYEAYLAWRTETGVLEELLAMLAGEPTFGFYDTVDA
jgi:quinol monooxygenase YgiN